MSTPSTLGPIACGVLLTRDIDSVVTAYQRYLQLTVSQRFRLDEATAAGLGLQALAGQSGCLLAGGSGRAWLMVIEAATAAPRDALTTHGWLSQEVLVADVDRLAARLAGSPFEVLRPPASLAVSERIRACQVRGPAGANYSRPEELLKKRSELISRCRHANKFLLRSFKIKH